MATTATATLNGGPTGGLRATSLITHSNANTTTTTTNSDQPPQDETCPVDSNSSSFDDSGHDDPLNHNPQSSSALGLDSDDLGSRWSPGGTGGGGGGYHHSKKQNTSSLYANENARADNNNSSTDGPGGGGGKKRRKQSRPVRIPNEMPGAELTEQATLAPTTTPIPSHQSSRHRLGREGGPGTDQLDYEEEEEDYDVDNNNCKDEEDEEVDEGMVQDDEESSSTAPPPRHLQPDTTTGFGGGGGGGKVRRKRRGYTTTPLNLSNKTQELLQESLAAGQDSSAFMLSAAAHFRELQQFHQQQQQQQLHHLDNDNSSNNSKDKTDLPGQGTKDSNPSNTFPSPSLFPLIHSSSPFFSFFPTSSSQNQQQSLPPSTMTAATPTSSSGSSASSNHHHGGSSGHHNNINNNGSGLVTTTGNLQNIPPHRIFNPEAYCDLCNKEFCNKYFLKTHKANKHGVYSDSPQQQGTVVGGVGGVNSISASSPLTSSFHSTVPGTGSTNLQIPSGQQQTQQQQQQQSGGLHLNVKSTPPMTNDLDPLANPSSLALSMEISAGSKGGGSNSNGSQSRDSFCDLCQKEFCNKYFLKRHKAKIHGIPMEQSTSSRSSSGGKNHGRQIVGTFSNGFSSDKNRERGERGSGDGTSHGLLIQSELENLGLSELVTKHHIVDDEDDDGIEEGEVGHGIDRDRDRGGNSNESGQLRFKGEMLSGTQNSPDSQHQLLREGESSDDRNSPPFKLSSLQQQLKQPLGGGGGLQGQLGVMSETTCQFCFREFSTKSLLRSHLTKKHRLLLPTFPPFLLPFQGIGTQMFDENHQQHPGLNMAAAAAAGPLGLSGLGLEPDLRDFEGVEGGSKDEVDYECNQCSRSFQTIYLLRMHKSYFHPDSDDMSDITAAAAAAVTKMEENSDNDSGKNSPVNQLPEGDHIMSTGTTNTGGKIGSKITHAVDVDMVDEGDEDDEPEAEATSDSDDLRRLQTMIMELNRVSSAAAASSSSWSPPPLNECGAVSGGGGRSQSRSPAIGNIVNPVAGVGSGTINATNSTSVCPVCSKEFYSAYFLQQHIQHYHASSELKSESPDLSGIGGGSGKKLIESFDNSPTMKSEKSGSGKMADGLKSRASILPDGSLNPSFLTPPSAKSSSNTATPAGGVKSSGGSGSGGEGKRPSPSLSRSYCTICHKELCNKYFMRTHMLKMHGISIESSTGLGGVTCDICNKELCSKYFLKVHKQNTHGIIEDAGPSPPNPSTPGPMGLSLVTGSSPSDPNAILASASNGSHKEGVNLSSVAAAAQGELLPLLANNQVDMQNRYFCHYSEVCPFCGRRFRSAKWLKTHLLADHGQEGKDRWKSIEKTLQHHQQQQQQQQLQPPSSSSTSGGRRQSKSSGTSGSGSKLGQKSKSGHSKSGGGSGSGQLSMTSNGSNTGNKCALCGFSTPDMEVMKVHLIKEHASQLAGTDSSTIASSLPTSSYLGQDSSRVVLDPLTLLFQKMEGGTNKLYRCAYCPFTTSLLVYLYAHERTHTGLANSLTQPQQQLQQSGSSRDDQSGSVSTANVVGSAGAAFQCPMCFQTFGQVDTFQQHLIGHQMSGVLAPFFTPPTSGASTGQLSSFLSSNSESPSQEQQQQALASLSLPLLNGALNASPSGDSLYWALKNSAGNVGNHGLTSGLTDQDPHHLSTTPLNGGRQIKKEPGIMDDLPMNMTTSTMAESGRRGHQRRNSEEEDGRGQSLMDEQDEEEEDENGSCKNLGRRRRRRKEGGEEEEEEVSERRKRQRGKIRSFRCSFCQMAFKSRLDCVTHIEQSHSVQQRHRRRRKRFRCRKCKFTSHQYHKLLVHNRVHHHQAGGGGGAIHGHPTQTSQAESSGSSGLMNSSLEFDTGIASHRRRTDLNLNLETFPQGRAIPQEGVDGDYLMQGFLLSCTNDEISQRDSSSKGLPKNNPTDTHSGRGDEEEENPVESEESIPTPGLPGQGKEGIDLKLSSSCSQGGNDNNLSSPILRQSGLFVPSLIYLPVREKVSQSVRVSFSLTPTS